MPNVGNNAPMRVNVSAAEDAVGGPVGDSPKASQPRAFFQAVADALTAVDDAALTGVAGLVQGCLESGGQLVLMGNGGSAATASHLATDLILAAHAACRTIRVTAVHDSSALTTALANDVGFANAGVFFIETSTSPGDVLVIFSGSGRSPNLVNAAAAARSRGVIPVLIGSSAAPATFPAEHRVLVRSDYYSVIETVHSAVAHAIADHYRASLGIATACCADRQPPADSP